MPRQPNGVIMIRCVITVPQKVITGAFNILFSFPQEVFLTTDDFRIEAVEGDPLGDPRDNLKGGGKHWVFQCYIPDARNGRSRVVLDMRGFSATLVEIIYDTVRTVQVEWGTPALMEGKVEIPVSFDFPLRHLRKRNFRLSEALPFQVYRKDAAYVLIVQRTVGFSVTAFGHVVKASGVEGYIEESTLEV